MVHGTINTSEFFDTFNLGFNPLLVRLEFVTMTDHAEDSMGGEMGKKFTDGFQSKKFLKSDTKVISFEYDDAGIKLLCSALCSDFVSNLIHLKVSISNSEYVENLDPRVAGIVECMSLGCCNNSYLP